MPPEDDLITGEMVVEMLTKLTPSPKLTTSPTAPEDDDGEPVVNEMREAITMVLEPFDDALEPVAEYALEHKSKLESMGYSEKEAEFIAGRIHGALAEAIIKKLTEAWGLGKP